MRHNFLCTSFLLSPSQEKKKGEVASHLPLFLVPPQMKNYGIGGLRTHTQLQDAPIKTDMLELLPKQYTLEK